MTLSDIGSASADQLAPVLLAALHRLGDLGREGAVALSRLVEGHDAAFDEAAEWIADIAAGGVRE